MTHEARPETSIEIDVMQSRQMREKEALLIPDPLLTHSPEKVDAADAVFSEKQKESDLVAGLMGFWAGSLLLHDVVADHLSEPEEEEPKLKKRTEDEKDEEG